MIHIKLFEGFGTDDYYKEITHEEYDLHRDSFINMSKSDSYKLKYGIISDDYYVEDMPHPVLLSNNPEINEPLIEKRLRYLYCRRKVLGSGINPFTIVSLEDDWYLVCITDQGIRPVTSFYYKCDQWDGLIKLLKDKGLTK